MIDDEEDEKEDGDKESKERKEVRILSKKVARGKVLEALHSEWAERVSHINIKRIQERAFKADKEDPKKRVLQIDYAMAYQCSHKTKS